MAAALRPSGEVCIRSLLIEAVRGVCGANLGFDSQLKVEGLVAITVDDQEVTLVNFTETLKETKSTNLASPLREVSPLDNSLEKPSPADYRSPFKRQRGRRRYCSSAGTRMKRTHAEMTHGGWTADRENVEKTSPVHETRTQPDLPQDMESPPPIPNLTLQNDTPETSGCLSSGKFICSLASDLKSCLTPNHEKNNNHYVHHPLTSTPTNSTHNLHCSTPKFQEEALDLKVKKVRFDEEVVTSPSPTAKMPNPSQLLEETDDYSPSTCNICGQTLSSKRNLEQHLQRHYGIYQYHCEICGKGFSSSTNLKGHQWKHTNVKEFHCPYCGMEFIYKINLKRHVQKQHPEVEGDECLAD